MIETLTGVSEESIRSCVNYEDRKEIIKKVIYHIFREEIEYSAWIKHVQRSFLITYEFKKLVQKFSRSFSPVFAGGGPHGTGRLAIK